MLIKSFGNSNNFCSKKSIYSSSFILTIYVNVIILLITCISAYAEVRTVFVEPISLYGGKGAGIVVDTNDNVYIAENRNNLGIKPNGPFVSKVTPSGEKSYVVPSGFLENVSALALDAAGNLYVADGGDDGIGRNKIWKVSQDGTISTYIPYVERPTGLAFDSRGNLYVSSHSAKVIRKYGPDTTETAVISIGSKPWGLAVDRYDNLYIASDYSDVIYKVSPTGELTDFIRFNPTIASSPRSLVFDTNNNLWVTMYNGMKILKISPDRDIWNFPGGGTAPDAPNGIALDSKGNMFISVNGARSTVYPAVVKLAGLAAPALRVFSVDSDGDGIPDTLDRCPNTQAGATVDTQGCVVTQCYSQDQITSAVQNAVAEKDALIATKDSLIATKDQTIAALNTEVNNLIATIVSKDQSIEALNAKIATMYTKEQYDAALLNLETEKNAVILQKDKEITDLKATLTNKDVLISQLEQNVVALNQSISTLTATITAKDQIIANLNAKIATMYTKAQLDDAVLKGQQSVTASLSANLSAVFGAAGFVLPGSTFTEQITNLANAIGSLPKGQIDKLKSLLMP